MIVDWLTQRIPLVSAFWEKFLKFGMWLDITILKTIRGGHTLCLNFWPLFRWKSKMAAKDYITKTKLCIFQYMSKKQKISSPYSKTSCKKSEKNVSKIRSYQTLIFGPVLCFLHFLVFVPVNFWNLKYFSNAQIIRINAYLLRKFYIDFHYN